FGTDVLAEPGPEREEVRVRVVVPTGGAQRGDPPLGERLVEVVSVDERLQSGQYRQVFAGRELAVGQQLVRVEQRLGHVAPQVLGVCAAQVGQWLAVPQSGRLDETRDRGLGIATRGGLTRIAYQLFEP